MTYCEVSVSVTVTGIKTRAQEEPMLLEFIEEIKKD